MPEGGLGVRQRVLRDQELVLAAAAVQVAGVDVVGAVEAGLARRQDGAAGVDGQDGGRAVLGRVAGELCGGELPLARPVLGDEREVAVDGFGGYGLVQLVYELLVVGFVEFGFAALERFQQDVVDEDELLLCLHQVVSLVADVLGNK